MSDRYLDLRAAMRLAEAAQDEVWRQVAQLLRDGQGDVVEAAMGKPRTTIYRHLAAWRRRHGVFTDGRSLRSRPAGGPYTRL